MNPADQAATSGLPTRQWFGVYTDPRREQAVATLLRDSGAEEVFVPFRATGEDTAAPPKLLFENYVFFRDFGTRERAGLVRAMPGVRRLLGADDDRPSPIADEEILTLKGVCALLRDPILGPMPTQGMTVRVISGLLQGTRGVVKERNARFSIVSFPVPVLAGAWEVELPSDSLQVLRDPAEQLAAYTPRHRSGRRTQRGGAAG